MSVEKILAERQKTHGEFTSHAAITQALKAVVHGRKNWDSLSADKKESIDMILHKIGRILNGNPDTKDHWDDISGYATLVANTLVAKVQEPNCPPPDLKSTKINLPKILHTVAIHARMNSTPLVDIVNEAMRGLNDKCTIDNTIKTLFSGQESV